MIEGNVVWRTPKDATTSSAEKQGLDYVHSNNAESETKGSGITPQSISSAGKDTQSSNNEQGSSVKNAESDAIPTDDDGNVLYERVPIERTIRDLFDGSLDDAEVKEFIAANVEVAQRAHDKISNKPPKISTNKQKYLAAKAKWQGQVKAAKEKLDYWNAVEAERQKLTHTTDEEVEANERELSGEAAREDYRNNADTNMEVHTAEDLARSFLHGAKITPESFREETGLGVAEQRKFVGMISNQGKSIARLGEDLVEIDNTEYGGMFFRGDTNDARSAIIDALMGSYSRKDLKSSNNTFEDEYAEEIERQRDEWYYNAYHMTYEEYLQYESTIIPEYLRKYANFDEDYFYSRCHEAFYDDMERRQTASNNENVEENGEQGNDTHREEQGITQSNPILQAEEVDNQRGDNESQEQGGTIEVGTQGEVENGFVHQGAQGGVENTKQPLFEYFKGGIKSLIEVSKKQGSGLVKAIVANISDKLKADLHAHGIDITDDYKHTLDNNAIKHALNRHGSEKERLQGQLPITEEDIENVSDVINNYDEINIEENKRGQKNIVYKKSYPNGTTLYIEEVRTGRKELAMASIRKKATRTDANSKATPISDLNNLSADKDTQSSATKQVNKRKSTESNAVSEDLFATAERVAVEDEAKRTRKKEEAKVDKRLVSDERMEELKKRLREKLRGQLNMGIDPELLAIGTEIAVGHIERGVSKFSEYAKTMIEDLGDTIRPYLKAFYNGARDMPELGELADQLTPYEEVRTFNVATIGEEGEEVKPTILQQAEQISNEHQVEQKTKEEAKQTSETTDVDNELYSITKQHNQKKDVDIWVVRGKERVERDVFLQQKQAAKQTNGYYSSFRGVNGFVFTTPEEAQLFADNAFIKQQQDQQGNPINEDGTLKVEKVNTIDEITDIDFDNPTRNIELPTLPQNVDEAIGANGKPIVIKKNIFERNKQRHNDITPEQSRDILSSALYTPTLYGQNQKNKRPKNWVVIKVKDNSGNNKVVLLEVDHNKDNVEIIHWHYLDDRGLEKIKRQASREDGQLLILPSESSKEVGALSNPTQGLSSAGKDTQSSATKQVNEDKFAAAPRKEGESILDFAERVATEHQSYQERKEEEAKVDTNPTDAQKEAGNYKKGHIKVDGMDVTIEQPKGSVRRGKDADGKEWESEMHNTYGYIRGTESVDGDHIDIFLSDTPESGNVFVIDQVNKDGSFDEHKVMYGFADMESAKKAYLSNYEDGWQGLGNITEVSKEKFKNWIDSSKRKPKPFAEYSSVKKEGDVKVEHPIESSERTKPETKNRLVTDERIEGLNSVY